MFQLKTACYLPWQTFLLPAVCTHDYTQLNLVHFRKKLINLQLPKILSARTANQQKITEKTNFILENSNIFLEILVLLLFLFKFDFYFFFFWLHD